MSRNANPLQQPLKLVEHAESFEIASASGDHLAYVYLRAGTPGRNAAARARGCKTACGGYPSAARAVGRTPASSRNRRPAHVKLLIVILVSLAAPALSIRRYFWR
jgi:hypothetical protein